MTAGKKRSANQGSYTDYTLEDRAKIGKYTTEIGPARATRHLAVPEMTVRSVLDKSVKFVKTTNNMYILGESAKYCSCHIFPAIHIDMITDIIETGKIYLCQYTHVLQRFTRLWL